MGNAMNKNVLDLIKDSGQVDRLLSIKIKREDGEYSDMTILDSTDIAPFILRHNLVSSVSDIIQQSIYPSDPHRYMNIDKIKEAYKPNKNCIDEAITSVHMCDALVEKIIVYINPDDYKRDGVIDQIGMVVRIHNTTFKLYLLVNENDILFSKNIFIDKVESVEYIRDVMLSIIEKEYQSGLKSVECNKRNSKERIKELITRVYKMNVFEFKMDLSDV